MYHPFNNSIFFANKLKEIDFCGGKIFTFEGGRYTLPTDFTRLEYSAHKTNECLNCKKHYDAVLETARKKFDLFPMCCEQHKKLIGHDWFKKEDFKDFPKLFSDKVFASWDHILNNIDKEDWDSEIFDFLEHIFISFGSFPSEFGEPLHFSSYTSILISNLEGLGERKQKADAIIDFIKNYYSPKEKPTDFNIILKVYNSWYKTFPFELSFFSDAKNFLVVKSQF